MTGRAATPTHYHLRLRIPGWLLAAALLIPALFLGYRFAADQFDRAEPDLRIPVRVTTVHSTVSGNAISVRLLIESNDEFDPLRLRYTVHSQLADGSPESLPTGASILGPGAWEGRSIVVQVDRILSEGATFRGVEIHGANWSAGTGPADPVLAPRSAVENWGEAVIQ